MMIHIVKNLGILGIGLLFLPLLPSCNGQTMRMQDCKLTYKNALTALIEYYKTGKTYFLEESLNNLEQSIKCPETRYKSIDMKISLLVLLKRYQWGYEFVDSLRESDFNAAYKKQIDHDYFHALEYESRSDTTNRNKLLTRIIINIQQYIQKENLPKDSLDEDAYLTLFLFKKKILDPARIDAEIETLRMEYPNEKEYLDGLKNIIGEKPQFSSPVQQPRW